MQATETIYSTPTNLSAMRIGGAAFNAGLPAPTLAEAADLELIEVCKAFLEIDAFVFQPGISEEAMTASWAGYYAALERLTELRAVTNAGRKIKALAGYRAIESVRDSLEREEMAAWSALADIVEAEV